MSNKIERLNNRISVLEERLQEEIARGDDTEGTQIDLYETKESLRFAWADDEAECNGWE